MIPLEIREVDFDRTISGEKKVLIKEKSNDTIAVSIDINKRLIFYTGKRFPVYFYDKDFISMIDFINMIKESEEFKNSQPTQLNTEYSLPHSFFFGELVGYFIPDISILSLY